MTKFIDKGWTKSTAKLIKYGTVDSRGSNSLHALMKMLLNRWYLVKIYERTGQIKHGQNFRSSNVVWQELNFIDGL